MNWIKISNFKRITRYFLNLKKPWNYLSSLQNKYSLMIKYFCILVFFLLKFFDKFNNHGFLLIIFFLNLCACNLSYSNGSNNVFDVKICEPTFRTLAQSDALHLGSTELGPKRTTKPLKFQQRIKNIIYACE